MENNVYSPPESDVVVENEAGDILASRWTRLFGSIIDSFLMMAFIVPLMYFTGGLEGPLNGVENSILYSLTLGVGSLLIFAAINGHYLIKYGQTVAKKLLNIRIVTLEGETPNPSSILIRYAVFFLPGQIPIAGQLLGMINPLFIFGAQKRCLHDLAAKTKVVKCLPRS